MSIFIKVVKYLCIYVISQVYFKVRNNPLFPVIGHHMAQYIWGYACGTWKFGNHRLWTDGDNGKYLMWFLFMYSLQSDYYFVSHTCILPFTCYSCSCVMSDLHLTLFPITSLMHSFLCWHST